MFTCIIALILTQPITTRISILMLTQTEQDMLISNIGWIGHVNTLTICNWVVPDASGTPNREFSSNIYPVLERIRGCVIGSSIERILQQFNDFEYVTGEN